MPRGDGPRPRAPPRVPARSSLLRTGSPTLPRGLARRVPPGPGCPASTRGRGALAGPAIRTADVIGGSSCHPLDRSDELPAAVPEGIGDRDSVFLLIRPHDGVHLGPGHVLAVDSDADHFPPADPARAELEPLDLFVHAGHGPRDDVPPERPSLPGGGVHH